MIIQKARSRIQSAMKGAFIRDEDGSLSIEAMILTPMIFWSFLSMFSIFDTFRAYSVNQKAAYTIGDAVSRETQPLDGDYLDGMWSLYNYLAQANSNGAMRITSVVYNGALSRFEVDWSQTRGTASVLTNVDLTSSDEVITGWREQLPTVPNGERVMLVETWDAYDPPFATGLEEQIIHNRIYTRPRYAPRVCWEQCN